MTWAKLAGVPLVVEDYELELLESPPVGDFQRVTTLVRLRGRGQEGMGEEIGGPFREYHEELQAAPKLPLAGEWTLEAFCDHLASVDQWYGKEPEWEMSRRWRNWAYESAALDLALLQAGAPLHEVLGLEPRPVRFVNSLGLGDPPSPDTIFRRLERYPTVGFKLDAAASWTPEIIEALAGTGAVRTVDFKGRYGMEIEDVEALPALYDAVIEALPEALLEDPHDLPEINERIAPYRDRISFDAPIARVADIGDTRTINIKPSRIGDLRSLLDIYEHCAANGIAMYGGGMGELDIARGQIELLASLFHPDSPNDVAPTPFNDPDPPDGLPPSPLDLGSPPPGFRIYATATRSGISASTLPRPGRAR
jgi:L-alanine-DL-glutamate epimerase-like enolase superfamily enzyme